MNINLEDNVNLRQYSFFRFQNSRFLTENYIYSTKTLEYTTGDLKGQPYLIDYFWVVPLVKKTWQPGDSVYMQGARLYDQKLYADMIETGRRGEVRGAGTG